MPRRTGLLRAVFSYRPRVDRRSDEDFLTEALAFAYRSVPGLASHVWPAMAGQFGATFDLLPPVETQLAMDSGHRCDLVIFDTAARPWIFEHKVDANINALPEASTSGVGWRTQLDPYADHAKAHLGHVVLVARVVMGVRPSADRVVVGEEYWSNVHAKIRDFGLITGQRTQESFVLGEILDLMEVMRVSPVKIGVDELAAVLGYNRLWQAADDLLESMTSIPEKELGLEADKSSKASNGDWDDGQGGWVVYIAQKRLFVAGGPARVLQPTALISERSPRFRLGLYCYATPDGGEVTLDLPDDFVAFGLPEWSGTFVVLLNDKDCIAASDLGKALGLRLDRLLPALHIQ